jgi:glyoxylase-like metal-dependent hydrolase (beta-lactamase superfamily II)
VQHSSSSIDALKNECPICLDPRQYVPATGQAWLTLAELRSSKKHKNIFHPMDADQTSYAHLIAIRTEPQVAIGQTAYLVRTPDGNVLWDCITYLDDETIEAIKGLGGLKAIAISHPHFYSTNVEY